VSEQLFQRARRSIVGGVNSPVRAFGSVNCPPLFAERGEGAFLFDADGKRHVDYVMSWGAIILGHAAPPVLEAIEDAASRGCGYGMSTGVEAELAELICQAVPSIELLRMVNSGTEAVMSAIRVARGFTGRSKVVKSEGGYHGHSDGLLAQAGSGLATLSLPASAGVTPTVASETLLARYNDLSSVEALFAQQGDDIACIVVEPVAGNMGVVPPANGFLPGLRQLCDDHGALLIFDEVITGFRLGWGGAQECFAVRPDLTTLGKIIGGGLPVGAFGGRRDVMERLAPLGDVYQAGTLSGNPVVVSAGLAALTELQRRDPYTQLVQAATDLTAACKQAADDAGVPLQIGQVGGMFTLFFADQPVTDYASARRASADRYATFFRSLLQDGLLLPPSQWESCFLSVPHLDAEIHGATLQAIKNALKVVASQCG
jgi:glutamate-1-semialdehyde 2,1-aminomutase